jgi:hypothetical protein
MNTKIKIFAVISLMLLLVSVCSISAVFGAQSPEARARRLVEFAEGASQTVGVLFDRVYANVTILDMIDVAGLTSDLEGYVTFYDGGVENVSNAFGCLEVGDFDGAVANSTEALSVFRDVYKSIHVILYNSGVRVGVVDDAQVVEAAIQRSLERVHELKELISTDAMVYDNLTEAEELLTEAKDVLLPDNVDDAKTNLREANMLISEVCQYLRDMAAELDPQRIRAYCEIAYQYRERFRERFRQEMTDGLDVRGFLQGCGYQNEDDFMERFQEMIQNAEGSDNVEDAVAELEEIGSLIRQMDQSLIQEMGRHRAQMGQIGVAGSFGQEDSIGGFGQDGSGIGGNCGSGQMGSGGNR